MLVDMSTADDAGVVRIGPRQALVHTLDVITPIVDEPASFGRIAAANAISDVYAMGALPTSAVSFLALPKEVPARAVTKMLQAAREVFTRARAPLVGGHTVKDKELKFGFAVTGMVDPRRMTTNSKARGPVSGVPRVSATSAGSPSGATMAALGAPMPSEIV